MMVYPRALVARHIYARTVAAWPSAEPTDKPPGRYPPIRCPRPPRDARELAPIPAGPARRTRAPIPGRPPNLPAPYPRADTGYNQTGPTLTQPRGPLPAPIPGRQPPAIPGRPPDPSRTRTDHRTQVCYNHRQQTRNPPSNTHSNPKPNRTPVRTNKCSNRPMSKLRLP